MKLARPIIFLCSAALVASLYSYNNHKRMNTTVSFPAMDGVTIVGDFSMPTNAKKAVLLLHMMPATRQSFTSLSAELNKAGFATLAIDLRGHGESTSAGKLDYTKFQDKDHQASRLDVDAAMNFLKGKGFGESHIVFVGASIGANLALDAMYRYKSTERGVLLSPGLDYRGVKTEQTMKALSAHQKVWLIAAEGDTYSADSVRTLQKLNPAGATLTMFKGSDHGTALFSSQKTLIQDAVKYFR